MAYYFVIMERNKYVRDIEYKASKAVEANNPIETQEIAENIANENLSDEEISNHGKYIAISIEYIFNPQGETLPRLSPRNCTNNASF